MRRLLLCLCLLMLLATPALAEAPPTGADRAALVRSQQLLAQNGDPVAARAPLEARLREAGATAHGLLWLALGNLQYQSGAVEAALASFRTATRRLPQRLDAWRNLGLVAYDLHRYPEAVQAFAAASELAPDNGELRYLGAAARYQGGDAAGAAAALRRLCTAQPDGDLEWLELWASLALTQVPDDRAAVRQQVAARLQAQPDAVRLWDLRWRLALAAGDGPEAAASLAVLARLRPDHAADRRRLAQVYAGLDLPLAAARQAPAAGERLGWLAAAGRWDEVATAARESLGLKEDAAVRLTLGRALYRLGRYAEARQALQPLVADSQGEAALLSGRCSLALDQPERALADFDRAVGDPRYGASARALSRALRELLPAAGN